jgi:hypothetical protein
MVMLKDPSNPGGIGMVTFPPGGTSKVFVPSGPPNATWRVSAFPDISTSIELPAVPVPGPRIVAPPWVISRGEVR